MPFVCFRDETMHHGRAVMGIVVGGRTKNMSDERREESKTLPLATYTH